MLIRNLQELAAALPSRARLLGLDVGTKTIGVALSDEGRLVASGRETIRRTKLAKDLDALAKLVATEAVGAVVIGLPLNMDGSEGPRCQSVRQFGCDFEKRLPALPLFFWDERLSTMAVTRTMLEADLSRARRAEVVDKLAAVYILQGVLDGLRGAAGARPTTPPRL
ncbi:MAG: Holliday junction resolvase RuvX [Alphaproteobacteria bacterium]|nr:Holliday junction resolvase RuvX [Alphaproteobacteria bacterium]